MWLREVNLAANGHKHGNIHNNGVGCVGWQDGDGGKETVLRDVTKKAEMVMRHELGMALYQDCNYQPSLWPGRVLIEVCPLLDD